MRLFLEGTRGKEVTDELFNQINWTTVHTLKSVAVRINDILYQTLPISNASSFYSISSVSSAIRHLYNDLPTSVDKNLMKQDAQTY